jgi:hypothetical protein
LIRIAISVEAFEAIAATLPLGSILAATRVKGDYALPRSTSASTGRRIAKRHTTICRTSSACVFGGP